MTREFFRSQMERLQTRFGMNAFDTEFVLLVWDEAREMSEPWLKRTVDTFIGSKPSNRPPLLAEFREARLMELKQSLRNDALCAIKALGIKGGRNIGDVLKPHFGAVSGAIEAFRIARRRLKDDGSNDCNM